MKANRLPGRTQGALNLKFYCEYWLSNKSQLDLGVATRPAEMDFFARAEKAERVHLLPGFRGKNGDGYHVWWYHDRV